MRMDDPAILAELIQAEEDPEMKKYLKKQLKKTMKKEKVKKSKKKKNAKDVSMMDFEHFPDEAFVEGDDFGWEKKDAEKKLFKVGENGTANIPETEEESLLREAREAGEQVKPSDAPVGDDGDFGPTLPDSGIAPRPDTGAIPGGSKLKPVLDDEVIEARLRQKALEKAIQERLDKRLMRQKRIEVRLAGWIGKQKALKNEAKMIAEERLLRAQEITAALAPEIAAQNEEQMKNRNQIVEEVREKLRQEISAEVRAEIQDEENRKKRASEKAPEAPKVPAAVMDAIQMSDAWEQFWRRYKTQLVDWKHWDDEMEEYHKQAAGWYFTQGFIQSQVQNNVPAAPDEDPDNMASDDEVKQMDTSAPPPPSAEDDDQHVEDADGDAPPPPPSHAPEDEEADADEEEEGLDRFQKKIRKKKKLTKLERYDMLLKDAIFDPEQNKPKLQPWGAKDGDVRSMPGQMSSIPLAPEGAQFVPKASAMDASEKAKLDRMKRMLAVVRGPQGTCLIFIQQLFQFSLFQLSKMRLTEQITCRHKTTLCNSLNSSVFGGIAIVCAPPI